MKVAQTLVGIPPKNGIVTPIQRALVTRKGKLDNPVRLFVYALEKMGKTSFAAQIDRAIFMCKEAGTEQFDVERMPEPTHWKSAPISADGQQHDVFSMIDTLRVASHDFQALVIDTVDWLEPLVHEHVCDISPANKKGKRITNINDAFGGYGRGWEAAVGEFRSLISVLERLRNERRMHIILLAHAHVKRFNNPEGENFDRYEPKMHDKSAAVLKEWVDGVLFAHQEVFAAEKETVNEKAKNKMFGMTASARYLYTQRKAAWDAGNRYDLPEKLPLSWHEFYAHAKQKKGPSADEFIAAIHEKMSLVAPEQQKEVYELLDQAGIDTDKLKQIIQWVEAIQQQ